LYAGASAQPASMDHTYVLVMPRARCTLAEAMAHGGVRCTDAAAVAGIANDVALALGLVHAAEHSYGDLHPGNVLRFEAPHAGWRLADLDSISKLQVEITVRGLLLLCVCVCVYVRVPCVRCVPAQLSSVGGFPARAQCVRDGRSRVGCPGGSRCDHGRVRIRARGHPRRRRYLSSIAGGARLVKLSCVVRLRVWLGMVQGKVPAAAYAPPEWARALQTSGSGTAAPRGYRPGVAHDLWSLGAVLFEVATGWSLWQSRRASDALAPHALAALAGWDERARTRVLQGLQPVGSGAYVDRACIEYTRTLTDLLRLLLEPAPAARAAHFPRGMASVLAHPWFAAAAAAAAVGCRGLSFEHVEPPLVPWPATTAKADVASSPRSFAASLTPSSVRASIVKRLSKRADDPPLPVAHPVSVQAESLQSSIVQSSVLSESVLSELEERTQLPAVSTPQQRIGSLQHHTSPHVAAVPVDPVAAQPAPSWYTPGPQKPRRRGLFAMCFGRR
jgi:hypothetical protein